MDEPVIALAAGFAPATRTQWRDLAEKALKGAAIDSLTSRAADGVVVRPLYTADDAGPPLPFIPARRGGRAAWDIRAVVDHPAPGAARARIAEELAGGAHSILLIIDPAGAAGVAVGAAEGLAELLEAVSVERTTVALDAGFLGVAAAGWLAAVAKASPAARLAWQLDPLSAFAAAGVSPGPIESHLTAGANLAARLAQTYPRAGFFLASGVVIHEAGGGEAWELAFATAAAVAYAKAMVDAGLDMEAAFRRIGLGLAVGADPLISIAKLRAARMLWARITQACGLAAPLALEARSSRRMLAGGDPWTNLVRLTAAGLAGAVGGADSLVLGAFTEVLGLATSSARRLSRNIQLILMEEANVGRVSDPAGGSWALEALTADLAQAAWTRFKAIEAAGGVLQALRGGLVAGAVEEGRRGLKARLAAGEITIIGVTGFRGPPGPTPAVEPATVIRAEAPSLRLPGADSRCPPLAAVRLEELAA